MKEYIELLNNFQRWNPELILQMNQCSHHFNSDNINPYHAEGSVWAHIMLMYNDFLKNIDKIEINGNKDIFLLSLAISILCHDIGKVYNRHSTNMWGKVAFYDHSFSSVQPTIDFILSEYKNMLTNYELYCLLLAVSNHMDFMSADAKNKILLANSDPYAYSLISWLNYFDKRNAVDKDLRFLSVKPPTSMEETIYTEQIKDIVTFSNNKANIHLFCGVPGVGKDTYATKIGLKVVSWDDARVILYKEAHNISSKLNEAKIYELAWQYAIKKKFDLNEVVSRELKKSNSPTAICNTNLTRKSRNSGLNIIDNEPIKIVYIINSSEIITKRNKERTSKIIEKQIMNKFMYNQQIPNLFDFRDRSIDISSIELIIN